QSAVKNARYVIAQVNPRMPRTLGDGAVHVSEFHAMVEVNDELPEILSKHTHEDIPARIAAHCAELIEDGATLRMGIGAVPDAVLASLMNHKELGIHTEMFSDGIIPLIEKGIVTNQHKRKHRGRTVTSFLLGSRKLY